MDIDEFLSSDFVRVHQQTGSRIICNPPPDDTDDDRIVLVRSVPEARIALGPEWEAGGSVSEDFNPSTEPFESYRFNDVNLIITSDEIFYRKMAAYTEIARRLNVMDKADRIALSQAVRHASRFPIPALDGVFADFEEVF